MKTRNITRRSFLKWLGISTAAFALPVSTLDSLVGQIEAKFKELPTHSTFYPNEEYSMGIVCNREIEFPLKVLKKTMVKIVPSGYRKNVQIHRVAPQEFGRLNQMAWYYRPGLKGGYLGVNGKWNYSPVDGVYIWVKRA